ncbi:phosphohistidine phosphatase SixA [bacterium]|nr:phosphohistidine phosphatase SixA [bacterium]
MAIYLVQHGAALSKDKDPEKGLSPEGISNVKRIAGVAEGYKVKVSVINHSGKKRALQTANIFADHLTPERKTVEHSGLNPLDDVVCFANSIRNDNTMYVGHLPFMEKLVSWLITGSINRPVFKFQNGGIVCMDLEQETNNWIIKWTLMPNIGS